LERIRRWVHTNGGHVTDAFLADPDAEPLYPGGGYVRLWLAEGFLATARNWGTDQYPALHGAVCFPVPGGGPSRYTTLTRPPLAPGAHHDFPITPLLPYHGGVIEIDAALYRVMSDSPLVTVLQLLGALQPLLGPPLDLAAAISDKLGDGIGAVLDAHQQEPLLALHQSLVAPGGGGTTVRSGHCVVLGSPRERLAGTPAVAGGHLVLSAASGEQQPTGTDYLVLRVECRTERDDWNLPYLDTLIAASAEAYLTGQPSRFESLRTEAILRAYNSPDLVPVDRKRVALLVRERIDEVQQLGIVPDKRGYTLAQLAPERLVSPDDPDLTRLTLDNLFR
jgi:hypothetical protein